MKKEIHPKLNNVVFIDTAAGVEFFTTSTLNSEKTREKDGVTYFEIPIEISSASHPFFTGKQVLVDTARRVEKFHEKAEKTKQAAAARKGKKVKRDARAKAKQGDEEEDRKKKTAKKEAK